MAMAVASSPSNHVFCSICLELYEYPRLLPCGHAFCTPCLSALLRRQQRGCPDCRADIPDDKNDVTAFPLIYALMAAIQTKPVINKRIERCYAHGKRQFYYCKSQTCACLICEDCWKTDHSSTKQHQVVPLHRRISDEIDNYKKDFQGIQNSLKALNNEIKSAGVKTAELTTKAGKIMQKLEVSPNMESEEDFHNYQSDLVKPVILLTEFLESMASNVFYIEMEREKIEKQLNSMVASLQEANLPNDAGPRPEPENSVEPSEAAHSRTDDCVAIEIKKVLTLNSSMNLLNKNDSRIMSDDCNKQLVYEDENTIVVLNYDLELVHKFDFKRGRIRDIAMGRGGGNVYVLYSTSLNFLVDAIDTSTGQVQRTVATVKKDPANLVCRRILSSGDVLILIVKSGTSIDARLYEKETYMRCIELRRNIELFTLINYILPCKDILIEVLHDGLAIGEIETFRTSAKKVYVIGLDVVTYLFWAPASNDNPYFGYLLATQTWDIDQISQIYRADLTQLQNGDFLEPLDISFMKNYGSESMRFLCGIGNGMALCRNKSARAPVFCCVFKLDSPESITASDLHV